MAKLNAYLKFKANCKEAMQFYQGCLGGELTMTKVGDSPAKDRMPAQMRDRIMHSQLTNGNIVLMGSDNLGQEGYKHGNTISLCLICESKEEIETLFLKLSVGGRVKHPLKEEFFGTYGDLTDKYGFGWMFQFSPKQQ